MTVAITFQGLNAPLWVEDPDVVLPLLDPVIAHWPHDIATMSASAPGPPFATLGPAGDGRKWRLRAPLAENPERCHDPIDAICDLIVEISWERLRSRTDLLCLHAAAVVFDQRLVIFPNARRAGKSLLTASLARAGHAVFTDDFIPLAVDPQTRVISGIANGIAPRLRLPLPETLDAAHAQWIHNRITTRNKRYGYLTGIDLPPSGTAMPVGAIVFLDRDMEMEGPPALTPVTADDAIAALVTQNFGRQVHAGAILTITEALASSVPVLRLTYRDVAAAADLLGETEALKAMPTARITRRGAPMPSRPAPLDDVVPDTQVQLADIFYRVPGYTEVETGNALYLASARGLTIQHLNPVSVLIWKVLEETLSGTALVGVLQDIYPNVSPEQLRQDVSAALQFMVGDGLLCVTTAA